MKGWRTSPLRLYQLVQPAVVVKFMGPHFAYRTQLSPHGQSQTQALFFGFQEANSEDDYIFLYFCLYLKPVSTNKSQRTEIQSMQRRNSVANKVLYYL